MSALSSIMTEHERWLDEKEDFVLFQQCSIDIQPMCFQQN